MLQQQLPLATSYFSPKLKRAQITQTKSFSERLLRGQPLLHAVHADRALLPSKPCQGNARGRPPQATVAQRRCVRLQFHRRANRARDFFAMAIQ